MVTVFVKEKGGLLKQLEPESWWQAVFCVNNRGHLLGFMAAVDRSSTGIYGYLLVR